MENPLLTFVSPTVFVGDGSQLNVILHEIVHSWTGNLVTCSDWQHFWLNEGPTVFIERRILSNIEGSEEHLKLAATAGQAEIWDTIQSFGLESTYGSLHPRLYGDNPENSFSLVPYEKGFAFMYYIESILGYEQMKEFLRYFIKVHKMASIDSEDFQDTLETFMLKHYVGDKKISDIQ